MLLGERLMASDKLELKVEEEDNDNLREEAVPDQEPDLDMLLDTVFVPDWL